MNLKTIFHYYVPTQKAHMHMHAYTNTNNRSQQTAVANIHN